ncbi:MAG: hypothetical protein GY773_27565, partial [Actinomycetia bacterium]|nr:hypothetical protein [Actinomycetes bacterium]
MSISLDQWLWAGSLALTGIWVGTLYDAVQWSDADWDRAGLRKLPWFLILVLLSVVG